jgi:hypothetical protein
MWSLTCIPVNVYNTLYKFKPVFRCAQAHHFWVFCWVLIALILDNPTASFNSLSNVPVLKGVVTARSWLTSDTLRWSWDPTSSVSSGAGTFGGETEV